MKRQSFILNVGHSSNTGVAFAAFRCVIEWHHLHTKRSAGALLHPQQEVGGADRRFRRRFCF